MKHKLMLAVLPAFALAACGSEPNSANVAMSGNDGLVVDDAAMMGNASDNMVMAPDAAMTGQQFADAMAASDMFEIESAKLAQEKAEAPAVKEFAAMMVKDHTASTGKLKEAAGSADPAITPQAVMDGEQTANLDALRGVSGAQFDSLYKQQQVAGHQKALTALQAYAAGGDVPTLKAFAAETATVVDAHLKHVSAM